MRNEVWSEIGTFLNGLRCGNVKRESYIQLSEVAEAEEQKKEAQKIFLKLPHSRSQSVSVSFCKLFSFLAIIQVLPCVFCIFHVIHHFFPYSWCYCGCFSFFMILNFHALLQVLQCAFLIYHVFPCFVTHTRSNDICVSFSTFFSVFRHNPGSRVCSSHFSHF